MDENSEGPGFESLMGAGLFSSYYSFSNFLIRVPLNRSFKEVHLYFSQCYLLLTKSKVNTSTSLIELSLNVGTRNNPGL